MALPLENFDFSILKDPEFKEDAVREQIVSPLVMALGYSATGINRIVWSRALEHPFVSMGTTKYKINIIPDYLLLVSDKPAWILDAKRPTENIHSGDNVAQAYSYAIHPDVRASIYALCNGHHFVAFQISKREPLLDIPLCDLASHWTSVVRALSPTAIAKPHLLDYLPDFGLHLLKLGARPDAIFHFLDVPAYDIGRPDDSSYTFSAAMPFGGQKFLLSFDCDKSVFDQLLAIATDEQRGKLTYGLSRQPYFLRMEENPVRVNIQARFGLNVHANEDEEFLPFVVERISK